jgi:hypothetical protein
MGISTQQVFPFVSVEKGFSTQQHSRVFIPWPL